MSKPMDVIHDSYVFEFIGCSEDKPMIESKLERDLVQQIEKFLLDWVVGLYLLALGSVQQLIIYIIMWTWFSIL